MSWALPSAVLSSSIEKGRLYGSVLEHKGVSLLSISDALELRRIMCRGGIEGYCLTNGVGNIPWLCYFFAILLNMFYRWTTPLHP